MGPAIPCIILIVILVIAIILTILVGWGFSRNANICLSQPSPFCYDVLCPDDPAGNGPCFGWAQRPGPRLGTFYCSNTGDVLFDEKGNIVE